MDAVVDADLVKSHCNEEEKSRRIEDKHLRMRRRRKVSNKILKTHNSVGFDLHKKDANHKKKGDEKKPDNGDKSKYDLIIVHLRLYPRIDGCIWHLLQVIYPEALDYDAGSAGGVSCFII